VQVPDKARRCVVFIGNKDNDGVFHARATAFLVVAGEGTPGSYVAPFLVTAEHNVVAMQIKNWTIYVRVNLKNGNTDTAELNGKWWFHPDRENSLLSDVVVMPLGLRQDLVDHDYIPLFRTVSAQWRKSRLGDEVFVMGLFKSHYGRKRNIPIVRIGTVAALPEEPVSTEYAGDIEAYLIEVKSIAGLSGSPAFISARDASVQDWVPAILPDPRYKPPDLDSMVNWWNWNFFGLVHGHFDVDRVDQDDATDDMGEQERSINAGIGIVIPAVKVIETLLQPELMHEMEAKIIKAREEHGATPDFDSSEKKEAAVSAAPKSDNPSHKEDFTSLLNVAAKKKPQGD
jgi:hypothetical protein